MPVSRSRRARLDRRRRRRVAAADNDLTPGEWAALQQEWSGCAYCGASAVPLQRDCVQPISRGGRYTLSNVVPACGSCNASKSNGEVTSWLRRRGLDEAAFLLRHHAVQRAFADDGAGDDAADDGPAD
ncbi:HNH endonuclease [Microbacterium sp. SD291]|uniref:HNH endonuclease n=1 Tax=Microbacterium sp. SD291 TaxID=2782007 RepID=UPI001A9796E6|nr:HNH endonuclease signature motif containing protein [Microbacterium sp. SD291]MBO0980674.1 HNH endonuclease [Microbacterium sp. SD291]